MSRTNGDRRMKLWDSQLGIWTLCSARAIGISGTTPRNADCWTLSLSLFKWDLWLSYGPDSHYLWREISGKPPREGRHFSVMFWNGDRVAWRVGR